MYADGDNGDSGPARAHHPGGTTSLALAETEARRQLDLRARADLVLRRAQTLRQFRHPLFVIPSLGAIGHFLAWLI